ncbi:killer toxin resistant protein, partial [Linderina pennispora]
MRVTVQLFGSLATLAAMSGHAFGASSESAPIRTKLEASFHAPPLLLEIAEGIAMHNASAFFPFIERLAENRQVFDKPDSAAYAQALEWISNDQLLTPVAMSLLKLELATRTYAPAVVAQYQLYNATVVPEIKQVRKTFDDSCVTWAQYKDKQACTVEALDEMLNIEKFYGTTYIEEAKTEPQVLDLDHV